MNFWYLILAGLIRLIQIVIFPLFGGEAGYHQAMGLASIIGSSAFVVLEVSIVAFGQFNLLLPLTAMGISLFLFGIKLALRIYMTIKAAIPVIG